MTAPTYLVSPSGRQIPKHAKLSLMIEKLQTLTSEADQGFWLSLPADLLHGTSHGISITILGARAGLVPFIIP